MKFWPQEFQMREGCLSCANGSNLLVPLWLCVSVYLKLGSHKHVTRISVVAFDQKLEVLFVVTNFYLGPETELSCLVSVSKVLIAASRIAQIAWYTGKKN